MTLRHYFIGSIIWATGITYYGLLYDIPHFFIGAAIVGIGMPLASLTRVYIVQSLVPEDKMGRAFSLNAVLLYFSNTISLALYGIFSLHVSYPIFNVCEWYLHVACQLDRTTFFYIFYEIRSAFSDTFS